MITYQIVRMLQVDIILDLLAFYREGSFLDAVKHERSFPDPEENLDVQLDHSVINALSASREKFPTSKTTRFLRFRRNNEVHF